MDTKPGSNPPATPPPTTNFQDALSALQDNQAVQRAAWIDSEQFLFYIDGSELTVTDSPLDYRYSRGTVLPIEHFIAHHVIENGEPLIKHWLPTQEDLLADDWSVVTPGSPGNA